MKLGLYPKLAWNSIRKNKKLYLPYILTCIGMIMMFYIISFLSTSKDIETSFGGRTVISILQLGKFVIIIFSAIFLFFTDSFITKRRKKEFGLYNILGMGKRNIALILFWETLFVALISLSLGLLFGVVFSKLSELILLNIVRGGISYTLNISSESIISSVLLFSVIFFLIFINTLRQLHFSKPIELLHSENMGEKKPKSNWLIGLLGIALLAAAYYIAITIQQPIAAMQYFFIAVIMVIVATYIIFISASVLICKMLQKNKKYYYKQNHFVSVSSMAFRMKRNGAGLASICILATMVLVMISTTTCLYTNSENEISIRYPRDVTIDFTAFEGSVIDSKQFEIIQNKCKDIADKKSIEINNICAYRYLSFYGIYNKNTVNISKEAYNNATMSSYNNLLHVVMIPLKDYNKSTGKNETLNDSEAIIYLNRTKYKENTFTIKGSSVQQYNIKEVLSESEMLINGDAEAIIVPTMYIVVSDFDECANKYITTESTFIGDFVECSFKMFYGFDTDKGLADVIRNAIENDIGDNPQDYFADNRVWFNAYNAYDEEEDVLAQFGALFFLGIMLSIVFTFAAVLTIYYKQISEGYEDQSRFEIMQKLGMTKHDIKKSINSQLLTVFFMPLIMAGLHLAFAFPMVSKMLNLFLMTNYKLFIFTNLASFAVFALLYVLVYKITANAYYSIVSGIKEEK